MHVSPFSEYVPVKHGSQSIPLSKHPGLHALIAGVIEQNKKNKKNLKNVHLLVLFFFDIFFSPLIFDLKMQVTGHHVIKFYYHHRYRYFFS